MNMSEVLSRAWQIVWKHKVLWIFGILAGCGEAGRSGGTNTGYRFSSEDQVFPWLDRLFSTRFEFPDWLLATVIIALVVLILVLVVLAVVLSTIGRAGVVRGVSMVDRGAEYLAFGELFSSSLRYFWRVFGLNLLVFFALLILVPLVGVPLIILTCGLGLLVLILFLVLVPVLVELSINAIVIEDLGVIAGLQRGWEVFKLNLGSVILMALILHLGIGLVIGFIIGLPLALVVVPAVAGALIGSDQALRSGLLTAGLCLVAYVPVLIVLSGILRTYIASSWTLTFLRLTVPGVPSQPEVLPEALPA